MSMGSTTTTTPTGSAGSSSDAKAAAQQGADAVKQHAGATAGAAKQEAANVVQSAAEHARSVVGTAGEELREQGRSQTDRLAQTLGQVSGELGRMAEQSQDSSSPVTRAVRGLADAAGQFSQRLEQGGPEWLTSDVARFARRKPGTFLALSAAAGFAAARLVRSTDTQSVKQAVQSSAQGGGTESAGTSGGNGVGALQGGVAASGNVQSDRGSVVGAALSSEAGSAPVPGATTPGRGAR